VRLLYLALLLTGTTFHLATGIQARWGWWRVFLVWSLGVAALVLGLTAAEASGWLPALTSLPPLALSPLAPPGLP
jgi:predicted membrane channel-forming protein YqfA (hemolysin III family)